MTRDVSDMIDSVLLDPMDSLAWRAWADAREECGRPNPALRKVADALDSGSATLSGVGAMRLARLFRDGWRVVVVPALSVHVPDGDFVYSRVQVNGSQRIVMAPQRAGSTITAERFWAVVRDDALGTRRTVYVHPLDLPILIG